MRAATSWHDDWSGQFPGSRSMGGLHGFTEFAVLTRHEPYQRRGVWTVALACGSELLEMTCGGGSTKCCAVMDDFGNLVRVSLDELHQNRVDFLEERVASKDREIERLRRELAKADAAGERLLQQLEEQGLCPTGAAA